MTAPLLEASGLRIVNTNSGATLVAGVDFTIARNETLGIVGESGSGKSIAVKSILGLLPENLRVSGTITFEGTDLVGLKQSQLRSYRGRRIGLILQDPFTMLNPLMRCGDIIGERLAMRDGNRRSRSRYANEVQALLAEVGIADPRVARSYPFELSGGMRQRVGIAAALALQPELLIADESTTALDAVTQSEIIELLRDLQAKRDMALIFITHDLRLAFDVCDRVAVMYAGKLVETGPAAGIEREPRHPYTLGLLMSEPPSDRRLARIPSIGGRVPTADSVHGQCAFAARCAWRVDACLEAEPALREVEPGRFAACIRTESVRDEMAADRTRQLVTAPDEPPRDAEPLVTVLNVTKTYSSARRTVTAVDEVSIEIGAGESVGLLGESGSGKTTLARLVAGLETATSGSITVDGLSLDGGLRSLTARQRLEFRKAVQFIFQDPYSSLNPSRSIGFTLGEAVRIHTAGSINTGARVAELLERVGLPAAYAARRPAQLSGGERQRVAIARALAATPRLIVCDEPVSALDVSVQAQVLNLLVDVQAETGVSYLFVTHDLAVVRQVTDRLYVMNRGQIVERGPTGLLDAPTHPYTQALVRAAPQHPEREYL